MKDRDDAQVQFGALPAKGRAASGKMSCTRAMARFQPWAGPLPEVLMRPFVRSISKSVWAGGLGLLLLALSLASWSDRGALPGVEQADDHEPPAVACGAVVSTRTDGRAVATVGRGESVLR